MLHILKQKYMQCKEFRQELQANSDCVFIEDTGNRFWGRQGGQGANTLGVLLHRTLLECQDLGDE